MTIEDLSGAWECFEGDGVHGWHPRRLVFSKKGSRNFVAVWLPLEGNALTGGMRLYTNLEFDCSDHPGGFRLSFNGKYKREWDINLQSDKYFVLRHLNSTAGATSYRRLSSLTAAAGP
jgi:hypothetical protein